MDKCAQVDTHDQVSVLSTQAGLTVFSRTMVTMTTTLLQRIDHRRTTHRDQRNSTSAACTELLYNYRLHPQQDWLVGVEFNAQLDTI